jgi:ABC-type multidrug transport system fused ATPase/permease subunit
MLFKFLYRNLKGYRLLVVLAILVTVTQVGSDILTAFPLKFIPSKINNPGADPACTFPILDQWHILDLFDQPFIDPSLQDPVTHAVIPPPTSQCPVSQTDINAAAHPILTHHSLNGIIVFSVLMLIVFGLISALLAYVDLFLAAYIAQNLTAKLRNQLFDHLQRLSLDWHGKQKKGDLVQRITGNITDIEKLVTDGLVDLLAGMLTLVGVAAIMFYVSAQYTLISLAIAPALFLIVIVYTRNIKAAAKRASKAAGQVAEVATEDINALTVIKVFTREEREAMRFGGYVNKNQKAGLLAGSLQAQFTPLVTIFVMLGTAIVIGVGGYVAAGNTFNIGFFSIGAGSVDVGTLILFLTFLKLLYQPMRDLSKLANLASSGTSGAERIQEVLDQAPEVVDQQAPYYGPQRLRGEITFDHVIFGYTARAPILKGINLHIPAGRKVALVGLSGGGKTTLVKLIPHFYEIQQGSVKIDGVDNRMYPLNVLRQNVSMVLQDSVLFEGTIHENIAIGKPGATPQEIVEAAKKAQIHDTIIRLPDGYNTHVREQGKNFSGGQRQRLAIARAIVRDAPILILDEPTASLDVEAEAEVMHALDKLIVGRTVLLISHRLSTLGNVDEIVVLKEGQIVEQGSYKELKRQNGVFAALLEDQNRYNLERAGDKSIIRSAFAEIPKLYQQSQAPVAPVIHQGWSAPPISQPPVPAPIPVSVRGPSNNNQQPEPQGQRRAAPAPASDTAYMFVELDGRIVGKHLLNRPVLTVGRLSSNDIQVDNKRVSRHHAKIRNENGTWLIEDVDSVNGLLYEGRRVEKHTLTNGDHIHIAPSVALHYKLLP